MELQPIIVHLFGGAIPLFTALPGYFCPRTAFFLCCYDREGIDDTDILFKKRQFFRFSQQLLQQKPEGRKKQIPMSIVFGVAREFRKEGMVVRFDEGMYRFYSSTDKLPLLPHPKIWENNDC